MSLAAPHRVTAAATCRAHCARAHDVCCARYVEWALESSVNASFRAFHAGFLTVVNGPSLALFDPSDLELLVCGTPELDFRVRPRPRKRVLA